MESYTTISVKPDIKSKIKALKKQETYSEYLERKIEKEWEESEMDEDDLEGWFEKGKPFFYLPSNCAKVSLALSILDFTELQ